MGAQLCGRTWHGGARVPILHARHSQVRTDRATITTLFNIYTTAILWPGYVPEPLHKLTDRSASTSRLGDVQAARAHEARGSPQCVDHGASVRIHEYLWVVCRLSFPAHRNDYGAAGRARFLQCPGAAPRAWTPLPCSKGAVYVREGCGGTDVSVVWTIHTLGVVAFWYGLWPLTETRGSMYW